MLSQKKSEQRIYVVRFYKLGGDLLSRFRSTLGAGGLSSPVRHGKERSPAAIATLLTVLLQTLYD